MANVERGGHCGASEGGVGECVAFAVLKAFLSPGVLYHRNLPFSMRRT